MGHKTLVVPEYFVILVQWGSRYFEEGLLWGPVLLGRGGAKGRRKVLEKEAWEGR